MYIRKYVLYVIFLSQCEVVGVIIGFEWAKDLGGVSLLEMISFRDVRNIKFKDKSEMTIIPTQENYSRTFYYAVA